MSGTKDVGIVQAGRRFTLEEIEHIKTVVEMFPRLSRTEVANTLCEHLEWYTASGTCKETACLKLLERLEAQSLIRLPEKLTSHIGPGCGKDVVTRGKQTDPPAEEVVGKLAELRPVSLEPVNGLSAARLWNGYVDRYHYLGHKKPFGCSLRYFVVSKRGRVGCVLLAGATKSIGVRDRWIGWTDEQRLKNLPWVVNNSRFLVFPWVRVKDLASHVLGQLARRLRQDWLERWGYEPVLLETFVDPLRYRGTCYRAAGWNCLGYTTGEGLVRPGRSYKTLPKRMFVRPLVPDFRSLLCSNTLRGREAE